MGVAEELSFRLASEKFECLSDRGADEMVVACPSRCIAYENNQKPVGKSTGMTFYLPILYFTQVFGLAMGSSENEMGFEFNRIVFTRPI